MINQDKIYPVIEGYKKYFPEHWKNEKYKWEAVKHFQDNWNINAEDFGEMFKKATKKADNLLGSAHAYPRGMMLEFAKADCETTKQMFIHLYDESLDLAQRIDDFIQSSEELRAKYDDGTWKNHYQNLNVISVYLWLRFPDKYYIYKYELYKAVANELESDYLPIRRSVSSNIIGGYAMYNEICRTLQDDEEIQEMLDNALTENCYPDTNLKTLTMDFGFYLCRFYSDEKAEKTHLKDKIIEINDTDNLIETEWYPSPAIYSPNLSVNDWKNLLKDKEVFDEKCIDIFRKIYELGGQCTCKELSQKYGYTPNYYNVNAFNLAKRVHKKSNCPVYTKLNSEQKWWWCIPFLGKDVKGNYPGVYFLKLREELAKAIKDVIIDQKENYTKENFLADVFMSVKEYDKLTALLKRKKNIILQGAPGVGKTFCAKRLAWSLMGEKNNDRVCMVQFHQSYSYEDFIMGYRPTDNGGFELEKGVFYRFCETAKNDPENDYFFIIDEINRGNLSKIFGELLMLIENDKRGSEHQINLVYGSEPFYIPENLYIIGMMNTADRSLAMIDYALRRRFSFYTMPPAFEKADENGFAEYIQNIKSPLYHSIIAKIIELNKAIKEDTSLGKGFEIGHSYFISDNINDEWVKSAVEYEIIPLIEEYWFDNEGELSKWKEKLYLAIGEPYDE